MKTKMPNSIRKHIRTEKARIRRDVFNIKEQKDKINKLYIKVLNQDDNKVSGNTKTKD